MPDWDYDSPQVRSNLRLVLRQIARAVQERQTPTVEEARRWLGLAMKGLGVPDPCFVGAFRGEPGLDNIQVRVGGNYGVSSADVAEALRVFETKLQALVAELDTLLPVGVEPDADEQAAILDLCAWAHAEWVRFHPFGNGNGRTARLWANSLAMPYGLPPFVRLHPRPDAGYGEAGSAAMQGDWKPTAVAFRRLLDTFLEEFQSVPL